MYMPWAGDMEQQKFTDVKLLSVKSMRLRRGEDV